MAEEHKPGEVEKQNDYLWDRSGAPDPSVQRLETLLSRFAHPDSARLDLPVVIPAAPRRALFWQWRWRLALAAGAAASIIVAILVLPPRPGAGWAVASLGGTPKIGWKSIQESGRLLVGQWLETDDASRARIQVGRIGEVDVEPNTRIRLLRARDREHRLALDRGTMHARILAPPGQFAVETASALAVDLGCSYTLTMDDAGSGLLEVTHGWVAFEKNGRESFVPAGAMCYTRPGIGPGTPFFASIDSRMRDALERLDFETLSAAERAQALDELLDNATKQDALTIWHLLRRVHPDDVGRVYTRLAMLAPPPAGVTREGILFGDRQMLDMWWNSLGYGNSLQWRIWKGPPPTDR